MNELELSDRLCWADIESAGLDTADPVFELGIVVTDGLLEPLAVLHALFAHDLDTIRMSEWAWKTHTINGLLDELRQRAPMRPRTSGHGTNPLPFGPRHIPGFFLESGLLDPDRFESELSSFIERYCKGAPLAGSTVHFDRSLMKFNWRRSIERLHYRNVDVSSFREVLRRWRPDVEVPEKSERHRVFDDLTVSIASARLMMGLLDPRPQITPAQHWLVEAYEALPEGFGLNVRGPTATLVGHGECLAPHGWALSQTSAGHMREAIEAASEAMERHHGFDTPGSSISSTGGEPLTPRCSCTSLKTDDPACPIHGEPTHHQRVLIDELDSSDIPF